ncbi:MAG: hypothetical protein JNM00_00185, partial [Flavobacteriales bacterium]|nr:hypothetical protein [Flavobacteriales bacterium]
MKKFTFSFSLATLMSLLTVFAYGQSCPSDDINDQLIQSDPVFARSYMYLEQAIAAQVALDASERTDDIYVIPVVVHVIHEGEAIGSGS